MQITLIKLMRCKKMEVWGGLIWKKKGLGGGDKAEEWGYYDQNILYEII